MRSLNQIFQLAGLASIITLLMACTSTPKISTDYDPQYDFASIKTYYLVEHNLAAQIGGTSLTDQRATREITAEMERRGISAASAEEADIIVTFHIVAQDRTKVTSYNNSYGYTRYGYGRGGYYGGGTQVDVRQYTEGTLLVDLVAPKEKRIVWRGQTSAVIRDRSNEERDARAKMFIEAMFNHMPPPIGMTQK